MSNIEEGLFLITIVVGGLVYKESIIGRTASNLFVNSIKARHPNTTMAVTVDAYEFLGRKSTVV